MKKNPHSQKRGTSAERSSYPMRINKYLASRDYATRRGADALVERGEVFINGRKAVLGDKVTEADTVEVRRKGPAKAYTYIAYHKPVGILTHSAQEGERDIKDELEGIPAFRGLFPVGRLDKDSHGLIILTDDGRITNKLLNPDFAHEREYEVKVREKLRSNFKKAIEGGVDIEGYVTKPAKVKVLGEKSFRITLTEGKKHQIRRMVANLFNMVVALKRLRILNIDLHNLKPGAYRNIEGEELMSFLEALRIDR